MRELFSEYYPLGETTLKRLTKNASVVLDANVLLHVYRYTPEAADQLVEILTRLGGRLWMPHQVAEEFHRNRAKVILEQVQAYDQTLKSLKEVRDVAQKAFGARDRHPFIRKSDLLESIVSPIDAKVSEIAALQSSHDERASAVMRVDDRWQKLADLYSNQIGEPYDPDSLAGLHKLGAERAASQIPPGFEDADKGGARQFGDFILWSQILDHFSVSPSDVVFVTDDQKVDWWRVVSGRTLGPHPALRREFSERTGRTVHFYNSEEFVNHFAKQLGIDLDQDLRDEVERVSSATVQRMTPDEHFHDAARVQERIRRRIRERSRELAMSDGDSSGENPKTAGGHVRLLQLEQALDHIEYLRREHDMLRSRLEHGNYSGPKGIQDLLTAINNNISEIDSVRQDVSTLLADDLGTRREGFIPGPTDIPPSLMNRAIRALTTGDGSG